MAYFLKLTTALVLLFAVLITALCVIGTTRMNPVTVFFTNPDGSPCKMPCLFGVRPGEMTANEAIKMLRTHPFTRKLDIEGNIDAQNPTVNGDVVLDVDPKNSYRYTIAITTAVLQRAKIPFRTGDVISLLGNPQSVIPPNGLIAGVMYYNQKLAFYKFTNLCNRFPVNADLDTIWFDSSSTPAYENPDQWRGFTPSQRYEFCP